MPARDVVFPAGRQALYERNRYSPAVRSNGFLFVSGQVGSREDGSPEPDLTAQVRLAFSNLNAVLHAAGCTFDDVVDVTMFVVNPEANFETVWSIVPEFWGEAPYPTLTGIGVTCNRILLEVNDRICAMTGYDREELIDHDARIFYPSQEEYERVGAEKYRQITEQGTGTVETR